MTCSLRYDESLRKWEIALPDRSMVHVDEVIIDTPCAAQEGDLVFEESRMEIAKDLKRAVIGRDTPLPHGYVNDASMKDWECRWNPVGKVWTVFDAGGSLIESAWFTINCRAESRGPVLHARSECLANGTTFHNGVAPRLADEIHMRTLVVYDQDVSMNVMAISRNTLIGMGG